MKLKPEIKEKWLAALRSGEYVQGDECLKKVVVSLTTGRTLTQHCCLGVLCEILPEVTEYRNETERSSHFQLGDSAESTAYLPEGVKALIVEPELTLDLGSTTDFTVKAYGAKKTLAQLNDRNTTFAEIADIIEEQL